MGDSVSEVKQNQWLIRVERVLDDQSASGEVIVMQESKPEMNEHPHLGFAGARAWLAIAQKMETNDFKGILTSAKAGIEELGEHDYTTPLGVIEDTSLYIDQADSFIDQGRLEPAARNYLQVLEARLKLYGQLHQATIIE